MIIKDLQRLLQEEKFIATSDYVGCHNQYEKIAYSNNSDICLSILINAINNSYDLNYLESIIKYHHQLATNYLEEQFRAETEECDIRYTYFERICKICETKQLNDILNESI